MAAFHAIQEVSGIVQVHTRKYSTTCAANRQFDPALWLRTI
jgi:hypothetical protein